MDSATRLKRIHATIRDIPPGSVASYGQVAELAGIPRGARQVVYALKHVPPGESLPWFRVLRSNGQIAFETGSAGFREQRDRLREEGITVRKGRVDMARYRWQPDLDELLWKPNVSWDES